MKVYQRLAEAFRAEGCTATFGMMGDGNMFWLHELHKTGVKVHEVRHEGAGLGMADGWARTTRQPGIATATCGPGTTQLATAFVTAARANSPLVAFCGEYPSNDPEYTQRLDQAAFATGCEAAFVRMTSPEHADEAVRKAFHIARNESRPVLLSVPMDYQQAVWEDDDPYVPSTKMFRTGMVYPDPAMIEQAAELIAKAKKPVIIMGRGAQWSGAGDACLKLGDRIGALISTSLLARTWLSDKTDFHAGIAGSYAAKPAMELFHDADVVIGVGASLNRHTMENGYLFPNAKIIHIDTKSAAVMFDMKAADILVHSDARAGVEALDKALAAKNFKNTGYRTPEVKQKVALPGRNVDPMEFALDPGTLDPRKAVAMMDDMIPPHIGLLAGSGTSASGFTNMVAQRPRALVQSGGFFGCIGQMFPAAIGAVAATGNKPLAMTDGDASFMMHLAEFDTVVRYKMPLLVVVLNNESLGAEFYKLQAKKMDEYTSVIPCPNLGDFARSMGGKGSMARNLDELRKGLKEWVDNPCPMVIDCRISRTVLTMSYRRLLHGADI